MLKRLSGAACGILLAVTGTAMAQTYPSRPLTMIIPFAAGGPTDVLGRVMAQRMGEILGHAVRHDAAEHVGWTAGRERNDHGHRPRRIGLCQRRTRERKQDSARRAG